MDCCNDNDNIKHNDNHSLSRLMLQQRVENAMRHEMPGESGSADYREAERRAPLLIERESNVSAYLRYEENNVECTAARLAMYWKQRVALFRERAFLPLLDLSGQGALDDADIACMKSAWIVALPNDSAGRSVLCVDRSRIVINKVGGNDTSRLKCWFFWSQIASMKTEIGEMCLIRLVQDLSIDKEGLKRIIALTGDAFPVRLTVIHVCCSIPANPSTSTSTPPGQAPSTALAPAETTKPNKKTILAQLATPITASGFKEVLPYQNLVQTHVTSSRAEMLLQLLATRQFENAESLPVQLGGTWDYRKWEAWLSHRLRFGFSYEWNTQTTIPATTLPLTATMQQDCKPSSQLALLLHKPARRLPLRAAAVRLSLRKKLKRKLDAVVARMYLERMMQQDNSQSVTTSIAVLSQRRLKPSSCDPSEFFQVNTKRAAIE